MKWKLLLPLIIISLTISTASSNILIRNPDGTTAGSWSGGVQYIIDSDGTTYEATGTNFITALGDINTSHKKLVLPAGYIEISQDIYMDNCTVTGQGAGSNLHDSGYMKGITQINLTGNNTIYITNGAQLEKVLIYCPNTHGGTAINIYSEGEDWWSTDILQQVNIYKVQNENGTAINISAIDYVGGGYSDICFCNFNNININGFKHGLYIYSNEIGASENGFVNGNNFNDWTLRGCKYFITLDESGNSGAAIRGNNFNNFQIQPWGDSVYGVNTTRKNHFTNFMLWDWGFASSYALIIQENANGVYAQGWWADDINDQGSGNVIIDADTIYMAIPTSEPSNPVAGSMWVNDTTGDFAVYANSQWNWK